MSLPVSQVVVVTGKGEPPGPLDVERRNAQAVELAVRYGGIDGAHHKDWVIDQMVRALTGDLYGAVVAEACDGEDGPNSYEWPTGIAP